MDKAVMMTLAVIGAAALLAISFATGVVLGSRNARQEAAQVIEELQKENAKLVFNITYLKNLADSNRDALTSCRTDAARAAVTASAADCPAIADSLSAQEPPTEVNAVCIPRTGVYSTMMLVTHSRMAAIAATGYLLKKYGGERMVPQR